jgi:hypothetical protein
LQCSPSIRCSSQSRLAPTNGQTTLGTTQPELPSADNNNIKMQHPEHSQPWPWDIIQQINISQCAAELEILLHLVLDQYIQSLQTGSDEHVHSYTT